MMSQPHLVKPPRIADWLLNLFALAEEAESILGDLLEEFSLLASKSGVAFAQRWYWRQTIKTVPQLAGIGFRTAPWLIGASVAGGLLLRKLVAPLVGLPASALLDRYQAFFEHHLSAYLFFASTGLDIEHLISFVLIGVLVAFVTRQRELVATMALGLVYGAMAVVGFLCAVTKTENDALLWRLTWIFADAFAIVIAGAIVRMHRLAATSRPSTA